MAVAREEIFGPVLCVIAHETEEQAVAITNDTTYGLQGYVSTSDPERGRRIAERLEAGAVMVNRFSDLLDEAGIPAGGVKQSGLGREFGEFGEFGLLAYLEPQAILV